MGDAQRRVRTAILGVMAEYGVPCRDDASRSHPTIAYTVDGMERIISYSGGDPRAELNARAHARRTLRSMGLNPLPKPDKPATANEADTMNDPPLEVQQSNISLAEPLADPVPDISSETAIPATATTQAQESATISERFPLHDGTDYVTFSTSKYSRHIDRVQPSLGTFIAIKMDRDLMVPKGDLLVIPLHIPDTVWDMPEHEFRSCFQPNVQEPHPQPVEVAADPAPTTPPVTPRPTAVSNPSASPDILQLPTKVTNKAPPIGPQMGRILSAMLHLVGHGTNLVTSSQIGEFVDDTDRRQVSGMLTNAIKSGYVTKGAVSEEGRNTYKFTALGMQATKALGTWPWDIRELAYPSWMMRRTALAK